MSGEAYVGYLADCVAVFDQFESFAFLFDSLDVAGVDADVRVG